MTRTPDLIKSLILFTASIFIIYGCEKEYCTPTLNTLAVHSITFNMAQSGGEVTDNGGASVLKKGVCWNTSPEPTIKNYITNDGSGSARYLSNLIGLIPATTYYVRAYATNSAGTDYGEEFSFTTDSLRKATLVT